jgi:bacterial/archaeal transporter family protein
MPRWLLYTLITMLLWGGWGLLSKPLSTSLTAWQVQCLSTIGLVPVLPFLVFSRRAGGIRGRGLWLGLAAGIIGSGGNIAYYQALAAGGKAAAVMPLTSLYPLVTIGLGFLVLREKVNRVQMLGILLSLGAIGLFNLDADSASISGWWAVAMLPIALWGLAALVQKIASGQASAETVTLGFLLGFIPVAIVTPFLEPIAWHQTGVTWALLFLLGLSFSLGNLTLIRAYGMGGNVAVVTPMASLYCLITILLAVIILHERISLREAVAIALSILAILALSRETPPACAAQHEKELPREI